MTLHIALAGNPNSGKTTLFNALTGLRQHVGNWPGVTIEKKTGTIKLPNGRCVTLVDLPGTYMLGGPNTSSEDERIARDALLLDKPALIINVLDASALERNLYLTTQILEMGVPLILAINMMDVAESKGITIDHEQLSASLGCPVIPLIASRSRGLEQLRTTLEKAIKAPSGTERRPDHHASIIEASRALVPFVNDKARMEGIDPTWAALRLIEGDSLAETLTDAAGINAAETARNDISTNSGEDADILIAEGRYTFIGAILADCCKKTPTKTAGTTGRLDSLVLNKFAGIPIFLAVMYLMFLLTITLGGAFIDAFDLAAGALLVDAPARLLEATAAPAWLAAVVRAVGQGIQTVCTFIPIIGFLFLFLSALEDSGYMARAAFVADRAIRSLGLPGKAFVPLIVGFGCNVPAIMATRTLEHRRERILTSMMAPFMSCGARLPVFALFAAAFFPENGQNVVFGLYILGLMAAVGTGLVLKHTFLGGGSLPFIMELPPWHVPSGRTILLQTRQRLAGFVFRAGQVIVPVVTVLSLLASTGTDGTFDITDKQNSVLASASRALIPALEPLGIDDDNWPAAVGLVTGLFAKEAIIATLDSLYVSNHDDQSTADSTAPLLTALADAFATIPTNIMALTGLGAAENNADHQETPLTQELARRFSSPPAALAYMVLVLLYSPCVATLGAIRQEIGTRWMLFSAIWTTALAWLSAVAIYQGGTWATKPGHPVIATSISLMLALGALAGITLNRRRKQRTA
ncbi:Fe(2+) transporter permease subunit FeoB [Haematospirillum sp. 15-248]|uniref:Fe(2+) transporter permease subunit FeoB n=1 Tax=Haematospirillum sp. 15-248 TaxID=2723107 RepID=UPI001439E099|nr:Fe(2+) transporter permease subunit FeoB [Haematospirillum sp. 15-248]NKD87927.1 Fe(2+) transporter permease subunit FeoB [Haematospirillum sp. 15-248]